MVVVVAAVVSGIFINHFVPYPSNCESMTSLNENMLNILLTIHIVDMIHSANIPTGFWMVCPQNTYSLAFHHLRCARFWWCVMICSGVGVGVCVCVCLCV